jgi:RHS repeat-associated protein
LDRISRHTSDTTDLVINTFYHYDGAGRLDSLIHSMAASAPTSGWGTGIKAGYRYTYDDARRITSINSYLDGQLYFNYDADNQLTFDGNNAFTYDANGNRTSNYGGSPIIGTNNRLLDDGYYSYTYDDEGNRLTRTDLSTGEKHEYAWDHRDRLAEVTVRNSANAIIKTVDYAYDAFNHLVRRTLDADGAGSGGATDTFFSYQGGQVALQFDGASASNLSHRYLWNPAVVDQLLADETVANGLSTGVIWPLADHLGTIRDLATHSWANTTDVVNHRNYDAFGRLLSETNSAVDEVFGYTGRQFDDATGLQYNLNRWYDPKTGRWISEDPIGFAGGDTNLNRYVGNNPIRFVDPSGLWQGYPDILTEDERRAIDLAGDDDAARQQIRELIMLLRLSPAPPWFSVETIVQGGRCVTWVNKTYRMILNEKSRRFNWTHLRFEHVRMHYVGPNPLWREHHYLKVEVLSTGKVFYLDVYWRGGDDHIFFDIPWTLVDSERYSELLQSCTDAMDNTMH